MPIKFRVAIFALMLVCPASVDPCRTFPVQAQPVRTAGSGTASGYRLMSNVPYTTPADGARVGDLYLPNNSSGLRPAVIFIHGGGWSSGTKEQAAPIAAALANHGYVVFNINYRLVGQGGEFPGNVNDVRKALNFVVSKSGEWQVDTSKIAAMGGSAGGHLAMLLAYAPLASKPAPPRLAAVVSWFGPGNLAPGHAIVDRYIAKPDANAYASASPIRFARTAVPTLFVHGTADTLVPFAQSQDMVRALQANHIKAELLPIPGAGHGFDPQGWSNAINATLRFLDKQFKLNPNPHKNSL
jgi:glycerophosphoryl diester phosphodiesterase